MDAGRLVDAFGLRRGFDIQQPDAAQAYLQAEIRGKPTWVLLPQDQWPTSWAGMRKPVCRLSVALSGHPDSGTDWEHHCDSALREVGFSSVGDGAWPSCYFHEELQLLLSVYVDDFKLSGWFRSWRRDGPLLRSVSNLTLLNRLTGSWVARAT